jgi:FtsH-binding integral membrane protein
MSGFTSDVWDRQNDRSTPHTMSKNLYALGLSFFVLAGIVFAACFSAISYHWQLGKWSAIGLALGVLVVSILGTLLFNASDNAFVSTIGYAMVAGPFGLLLGPFVAQYTTASVVRVFAITAGMVIVLGIVGAVIPESLESWGAWLLGGLTILILGYFAAPLLSAFGIPTGGALKLLDWLGIVLFSAFVVFDLNRAMRLPRTANNMVDSAASVFMDFVNIFIRLLALTGQTKD